MYSLKPCPVLNNQKKNSAGPVGPSMPIYAKRYHPYTIQYPLEQNHFHIQIFPTTLQNIDRCYEWHANSQAVPIRTIREPSRHPHCATALNATQYLATPATECRASKYPGTEHAARLKGVDSLCLRSGSLVPVADVANLETVSLRQTYFSDGSPTCTQWDKQKNICGRDHRGSSCRVRQHSIREGAVRCGAALPLDTRSLGRRS
jgi:hypothetical protein